MTKILKVYRHITPIFIILVITSITITNGKASANESNSVNNGILDNITLLRNENLKKESLSHPLNIAAFIDGIRNMPEEDAVMYEYTNGIVNSYLVEEPTVFIAEYTYTYQNEIKAQRSFSLFTNYAIKEGGQLATDLNSQLDNTKQVITLIGDEGDIVYWILESQNNQMQLTLINGFDSTVIHSILESLLYLE